MYFVTYRHWQGMQRKGRTKWGWPYLTAVLSAFSASFTFSRSSLQSHSYWDNWRLSCLATCCWWRSWVLVSDTSCQQGYMVWRFHTTQSVFELKCNNYVNKSICQSILVDQKIKMLKTSSNLLPKLVGIYRSLRCRTPCPNDQKKNGVLWTCMQKQ